MKLLAFCFFPAFVPPSNGGVSRLFNFYRALSRWHQITLLTSTHLGVQEEVIQHGLNFIERRIPKDNYFAQKWVELEQYSSGGDLSAPTIAACGQLPTLLHKAYLEEYENSDALIFDDPFTAQYDLFAGTDEKLRIYNSYNCEYLLYCQVHPGENSKPLHQIVRVAEQRMLAKADLVLYCNKGDLEAFRLLAPKAGFEALYAPNGMTPVTAVKNVLVHKNNTFNAVFMGSGHPPNVQAAEFIVRTIVPAFPDIVFDMIGSCLPEGNYPSNLIRHGVVDDATKARILSQADIALNPMAAGSGSNVKVLEYFAYGIPVLSTSFGMRGIRAQAGTHYLECSIDRFSHVLKQAANDKTSIIAIGEAGGRLALEQYTWDVIARPVADRLVTLVDRKKQGGQQRFVLALNDYDSFSGIGGGGTRTRGLYEAVREWCPVVFVSFSDDGSLAMRRHEAGITVINVPKTPEHSAEIKHINAQFHISANDIIASRHSTKNPWLNAVYKVLRKSARCIVAEHCYLVDLPLSWGDRFVYSSQNNETELKKRLLEWHPLKSELVTDVERIERLAVEHSAATVAVSHEDAASLVKGKRTAGPVIVVRNGAATPASGTNVTRTQLSLRDEIGDRSVVFLGSAHMPNFEAAQFIVDRLAPQCPDVRFHLVGSVCGAIQQVPENVRLWGVVDETKKSTIMQSCALALNPMSSGSGSNVKLADYLGNGLFVITTEFGQRGYPDSIHEHVSVVSMDAFSSSIQRALGSPLIWSAGARASRKLLFENELAMHRIAQRFVRTLQDLERPRKRVLYVTYRYTSPALGGAEVNIEQFVSALGNCGDFDVDVIAPEVSGIHNHMRFSERYHFDDNNAVPIDIPNVHFARFPVVTPSTTKVNIQLRRAWTAHACFEQSLDGLLHEYYKETGITWGWAYPEGAGATAARWCFCDCGIFLHQSADIGLEGHVNHAVAVTAYSGRYIVGGPWSLEGFFSLTLRAEAGSLRLVTSTLQEATDPRPLGLRVSRLLINDAPIDLSSSTLLQKELPSLPAGKLFRMLDIANQTSRTVQSVRLTDGRGPWSDSMERFIADHVVDYDLVVTHNNVFRPAIIAINEAKKHDIPSILIPHAHLDDDFYHFPDLLESARDASLVLAVPKAACDFYAEKGCNVQYMPAGCDASEAFNPQDQVDFQNIYHSDQPFILVLGRKAPAKGYRKTIAAIEQINQEGLKVKAVLIGPDDDGFQIESANAVYLGRQPRNVVRGALMSCVAVCNMSVSESFGIVLLEAWLAGKPVIANKSCVAFHDMAVDKKNALLVDHDGIVDAIRALISNPDLGRNLAQEGRTLVSQYDWGCVNNNFLAMCKSLVCEVINNEGGSEIS